MRDKKIKLNNQLDIPQYGFGTFPNKEKLNDVLPVVINDFKGNVIIDTSDDYGNDVYVNEYLYSDNKNLDIKYLEEIVVCSKFSFPQYLEKFREEFDKGMERLFGNKEHVLDLFLLHWPYPYVYKDIWNEMEKLYSEGRVRAIGVCNFEVKHLKKIIKKCNIKPVVNQIELHPMFQQKTTCEFCERNEIKVMSYSPFARMDKRLIENPQINKIAQDNNKSIYQVILRWNLQKGYIALPASGTQKHAIENYDIFDFELGKDEMKIMEEMDDNMRVRFNPNTHFSKREKLRNLKQHIKYIISK